MKLFNFSFLTFALFGLLLASCGDDDSTERVGEYENGILIFNEGPFAGGSATVDYYDRSSDTLSRDVYSSVNDGQVIGSILQSATVIGDNAYLVVNNSAKIEVVDAGSMEYRNTITGVFGPRYMVDLGNGNAAVSEWGSDGLSGQVKLINLSSMTVVDSIAASGPEQMVVANGKLYVANSGGFSESNVVTVHNLDLSPETSITVGNRTIDMVQDANGDIWVLSGGSFVTNDGASLCKISNDSAETCIPLPGFPSDLIIDADGENIYLVVNGNVNTVNISNTNVFTTVGEGILSGTVYGLGYDGKEDHLYVGTTPDFSSQSTTYVLSENGELVRTLTTGVLTNGFLAR